MYKADYSDVYLIPPLPLQYQRIEGRIPQRPLGPNNFLIWWIASASFRISTDLNVNAKWVLTGNIPRHSMSEIGTPPASDPDILGVGWAYEQIGPYQGLANYGYTLDQVTTDGRVQVTFHRTAGGDVETYQQEAFWFETGPDHSVGCRIQINVLLMMANAPSTGETIDTLVPNQPGDPGNGSFPKPPWEVVSD